VQWKIEQLSDHGCLRSSCHYYHHRDDEDDDANAEAEGDPCCKQKTSYNLLGGYGCLWLSQWM
jgi:hypothetical protein